MEFKVIQVGQAVNTEEGLKLFQFADWLEELREYKEGGINKTKEIIIDAICGNYANDVMMYCKNKNLPEIFKKYVRFEGNQWNPGYGWRREELEKENENKLKKLYEMVKKEREERE
jgi:hypothetical protein